MHSNLTHMLLMSNLQRKQFQKERKTGKLERKRKQKDKIHTLEWWSGEQQMWCKSVRSERVNEEEEGTTINREKEVVGKTKTFCMFFLIGSYFMNRLADKPGWPQASQFNRLSLSW